MRRVLAAIFLLTFAAGALTAALLMGHHEPRIQAHAVIATPTQIALAPDSADDADDAGGDNWPDDADTPEQVVYAQPQMLRDAVSRLAPRATGKPNLYFIGFAGDAEEDVFLNEAEYARTLFAKRFAAAGHESPLVRANVPDSLAPVAGLGTPRVDETLRSLLGDSSRNVRVHAAWVLRDRLDEQSAAAQE